MKSEIKLWEDRATFLWDLLDSIDTVDDMAKGDDVLYRGIVQKLMERRTEVAKSITGYELTWDENWTAPPVRGEEYE